MPDISNVLAGHAWRFILKPGNSLSGIFEHLHYDVMVTWCEVDGTGECLGCMEPAVAPIFPESRLEMRLIKDMD